MIKDIGVISFDVFDDANIPVDIWLTEVDKHDESFAEGYRYELKSACYMPRKGSVSESALHVLSDNREELAEILKDYMLPLYQTAVAKINKIIDGDENNLYYWD